MAEVKAITPIQHGIGNGEVKNFGIGDVLTEGDFTEQELRDFIIGGSAVEIGADRKYSVPPDPTADPGAADSETRLRDELIAQSLMADSPSPADQPAAADAVSSAASAAGTDTTIGQVAATANAEPANAGEGTAASAAASEGQ